MLITKTLWFLYLAPLFLAGVWALYMAYFSGDNDDTGDGPTGTGSRS